MREEERGSKRKANKPPRRSKKVRAKEQASHVAKRAAQWLASPSGYLCGFTYVADTPTELSDIQIGLVDDTATPFSLYKKGRQVGFSFAVAGQGLVLAQKRKGYTRIFVSHNLDDASRKIRYARELYNSLPELERRRNPLVSDNKLSLEWSNGSRLLTQFMPRGEGASDVVLDEFAHMTRDSDIYTAALPVTSRGGRLIVGSTVLGQSGRFWEIDTGFGGKYQLYQRHTWPWWTCPELCADTVAAEVRAPQMTPEERVFRFGSEQLQAIFDGMPLEDFQQEYECAYQDERTAYFSWDLIRRCTMEPEEAERWHCATVGQLLDSAKGTLYAGYDVGRTRNASELTVWDVAGDKAYERYFETLPETEFQRQFEVLDNLLSTGKGKVARLSIDATGVGMQLAEDLKRRHGTLVEPVHFTAPLKEQICVGYRVAMERGNIALYPDRARLGQVHSIKKRLTAAKNLVFDVERNERHHADVFWSQALGFSGVQEEERRPKPCIGVVSWDIDDRGSLINARSWVVGVPHDDGLSDDLRELVEGYRRSYPDAPESCIMLWAKEHRDRLAKE